MATPRTAAYNFTGECSASLVALVAAWTSGLTYPPRRGVPAVDDASPLIRYEPANFWDDNVSADANLPVRSIYRRHRVSQLKVDLFSIRAIFGNLTITLSIRPLQRS
jgi:hypothetical protein